jgi:uncharacterized protein (DUF58 family)
VGAPELQRRPEIAAVRDLEIAARAAVAGLRHGRHAQPLVGAGPEVWGVRPYRQGDDAAQVDWKRSARSDRLYSRERADTSMTQALVVVDASRSMGVGHASGQPSKLDVARLTAAALVTLLVEQGDTVGLYGSTVPAATWHAPAGGAHHGQVLIEALAAIAAEGDVSPSRCVRVAVAHLRRPSLVIALSDGWDGAEYLEALRRAAAGGHDVAVLHVTAPGDRRLPVETVVELEDAETGEVLAVDAGALQASFGAAADAHHGALDAGLHGPRLCGHRLVTDAPLVPQLRRFLAARRQRT